MLTRFLARPAQLGNGFEFDLVTILVISRRAMGGSTMFGREDSRIKEDVALSLTRTEETRVALFDTGGGNRGGSRFWFSAYPAVANSGIFGFGRDSSLAGKRLRDLAGDAPEREDPFPARFQTEAEMGKERSEFLSPLVSLLRGGSFVPRASDRAISIESRKTADRR